MTPKNAIQNSAANAASNKPSTEFVPADLVVMHGREIMTVYALTGEKTIIGRNPTADLTLRSKYVSWKHAVIDFDGSGTFVADLCSCNATLVNNAAVDKCYLTNGDIISLGIYNILYHVRGKPEATVISSPDHELATTDESPIRNGTVSNDPNMLVDEPATVDADDESPLSDTNDLGALDLLSLDEDDGEKTFAAQHCDEPNAGSDSPPVAVTESCKPLDFEQIDEAVEIAQSENRSTVEVLEESCGLEGQALTLELARIFDYKTLSTHDFMLLTPDFETLPIPEARDRNCVLVQKDDRSMVVICDPFDGDLRPWIESHIPRALDWALVSRADLRAYISRHEQSMSAMESAIKTADGFVGADGNLESLSLDSISKDSSPVVRLVHSTLYDALRAGASDIHLEAGSGSLMIRYRIDGVLVHVATVTGVEIAEQAISRIKVMSELDIAERRIPQDGRFKTAYDGRPIDFRVSIMPSSLGEDAVLRVLDKQAVTDQMTELQISSLGFETEIVEALRLLSERPYGMLLVTGPTGSGKTTTLYAAISETNSGLGKIVTIEDPVEYQLPGVLQIPVNEKKGLTFARGLRSILRHDPDKIMVGEIRDPETAQIAVQSALTGHLVFTTVHANNVFDVLSRFTHMGVDPYSFVSALNGILAQRLLRLVCQNCGETVTPTSAMLDATKVPREVAETFHWRVGEGCGDCRGTGYKGRKAIGELLVLNDELREAIIDRVPVRRLKELAQASGLQFIRAAALNLVRDGLTTIDEVNRVTTLA